MLREADDGLWGVDLFVLVERGDFAEAGIEIELRTLGLEQLAGVAKKSGVVPVASQGAADADPGTPTLVLSA